MSSCFHHNPVKFIVALSRTHHYSLTWTLNTYISMVRTHKTHNHWFATQTNDRNYTVLSLISQNKYLNITFHWKSRSCRSTYSLLNGGIWNFMIYNICCPTWVKCRGKQRTFGESYIPDGVSLSKAHWHHAEQGSVDNGFNVGLANVGHHAGQLAMNGVGQQSETRKNGLILKLCKSVAQPVHQFCRSCIHDNFGHTHPQTYTHTWTDTRTGATLVVNYYYLARRHMTSPWLCTFTLSDFICFVIVTSVIKQ